jgi:hypothetical protein
MGTRICGANTPQKHVHVRATTQHSRAQNRHERPLLECDCEPSEAKGQSEKLKGPAIEPVPLIACSAFGNNRRRRCLALADVGLCRGRDARKSQQRCRQ